MFCKFHYRTHEHTSNYALVLVHNPTGWHNHAFLYGADVHVCSFSIYLTGIYISMWLETLRDGLYIASEGPWRLGSVGGGGGGQGGCPGLGGASERSKKRQVRRFFCFQAMGFANRGTFVSPQKGAQLNLNCIVSSITSWCLFYTCFVICDFVFDKGFRCLLIKCPPCMQVHVVLQDQVNRKKG